MSLSKYIIALFSSFHLYLDWYLEDSFEAIIYAFGSFIYIFSVATIS